DEDEAALMRAGIVYEASTTEPRKKLDAFCRNVSDVLEAARNATVEGNGASTLFSEWRDDEPRVPMGLARFAGSNSTTVNESSLEQQRAVELLEDEEAREFLRRVREAHTEGRMSELMFGDENETRPALISRMSDVGLLRREVLVRCRKSGRALFRLPSADALSIITASNAMCSECGSKIADEKIEEMIAPTEQAGALLEDGRWLVGRVRGVLRECGIPESAITAGPTTGEGEAQMIVSACDELFLFVLHDGDVNLAQARRALERQAETEAAHLIVVSTGKIQEDARARLREHARRRSRAGGESDVLMFDNLEVTPSELQHAFERASQRSLARDLYALDAGLGFSVGYMIATRFRLLQRSGALQDLAASAIGAIAGSLREI
ncbi:MAG TPA: hypothetical protein VK619_13060, partial [Pyrinomonadaceae bacterium]|nr:hypothetical protein [Pyrinomonadaceae bacterium]